MPTQKERQQYLWRPNDESSTTRTRYDLEADHFYRSFKSAERKHNSNSIGETFGVIGLILNLIFNLIVLIVLSIRNSIKFFRK